jgi:hypothetical protein
MLGCAAQFTGFFLKLKNQSDKRDLGHEGHSGHENDSFDEGEDLEEYPF